MSYIKTILYIVLSYIKHVIKFFINNNFQSFIIQIYKILFLTL